MPIEITSSAFRAKGPIPEEFTGEGADVSPPLEWTGIPEGTIELALLCDDPDAPRPEPWVHWVLYRIPATARGLPRNVPKTRTLAEPAGAVQGTNTWKNLGYGGPMPPVGHGVHHYHFQLFALDRGLQLPPGLDKDGLLKGIAGHVLAKGELIGTYERK